MSVHSCRSYCHLDERFHDLLKYSLDDGLACYWSRGKLLDELTKKRQELSELIEIILREDTK